ncbi:MAG: AEC family transporter [Sphaerochaetaceae bacterium]
MKNDVMAFLVFRQLVEMLLLIGLSYGVSRFRHYGDKEAQYLSFLLLYVIAPAIVIDPYNTPFDPERFRVTLVMLLFSFVGMMLLVILSLFIPKKRTDPSLAAIDRMGTVYSNCGYIGIPIVQAAMGREATFFIVPYLLMFNVIFWIHGQYVMTGKLSFKAVITKPMIIGSLFAFLLFLSPWTLPPVIGEAVATLSTLNMPLSMFLLGILFANFKRSSDKAGFPIGRMVMVFVLRLVVSPLVMILCFLPLRGVLSSDAMLKTLALIIVIVSACPCGVNITSAAVLFKKNSSYAGLLVMGTTILSVATIPVFTHLAEVVL